MDLGIFCVNWVMWEQRDEHRYHVRYCKAGFSFFPSFVAQVQIIRM